VRLQPGPRQVCGSAAHQESDEEKDDTAATHVFALPAWVLPDADPNEVIESVQGDTIVKLVPNNALAP
jgi:hypothetical protein